TVIYTVGSAGNYNVRILAHIADSNGIDTCNVEINDYFTIPLFADFSYGTVCDTGNSYELGFLNTSSFVYGTSIIYSEWSSTNLGGVFSYAYDPSQSFTAGTTDTITLVVSNSTDTCSITKVITVPEKPVAMFTPSIPACVNQTVVFTD